jgi:hypothetical protein
MLKQFGAGLMGTSSRSPYITVEKFHSRILVRGHSEI